MQDKKQSQRVISGHVTYSQAYQDLFVRIMTSFKRNGFYIEIGASDSVESNNSYILEKDLNWKGISFEIDFNLSQKFNLERDNICINADATLFDFKTYFEENHIPKQIDYLSLDVDSPNSTLKILDRLPLSDYRFSVITFEHDCYSSGPLIMNYSREIFIKLGYKRIVSNVLTQGRDFEDWYVDPTSIPDSISSPFQSIKIESKDIFQRLKN